LIYTSQTACYPFQRRAAISKLGNRYDCICNPEIMTAFVYALNDADHRVRREAADEIGDQVRKNCCCCPEVVTALTCALGDCDRGVVRQAEQALRLCGYDVVNGCCDGCTTACNSGCTTGCAPGAAPAMMPAMEPSAPAPVPPEEKKSARRGALSNLLGMLD
jgi:HEAT repeat protein